MPILAAYLLEFKMMKKMKIEQIYTGCLAEAAYYIESDGEAAIIDPLREPEPYLARAESDNAQIKYILETHFHADFVSGHLDLAAQTGAEIVYGPTATASFPIHEAKDGEFLHLGKVKIQVLHTPGHTMESASFLLYNEEGQPYALFSGDTVFINEVGRPDLAVPSDKTREELAGLLFDSIQNKILPLPDEVIIYPGHGAGSACGKNIGKETMDTLGRQRQTNYALREGLSREQFIDELLNGILPPPQYFPKNALLNKRGYDSFDKVLQQGMQALDASAFKAKVDSGALVLDTRKKDAFAAAHIPGSIFIGIDGDFAPWVGIIIEDLGQEIVIVADAGREEEVVTRLSRVGYDNAQGFLRGGIEAWKAAQLPVASVERAKPEELSQASQGEVLDLRKFSEFNAGHLAIAQNFPLDYIHQGLDQLDKDSHYFLHCKSGYRSLIGASVMLAKGFRNITDVEGGFDAISKVQAFQNGALLA